MMKQNLRNIALSCERFAASKAFFYVIVAVFTLSSIWVAVSSLYPMAFDEDFHLGLIKIYAAHLLPYGIEHTNDMAKFGSATHDPSYFFQYLLSFPYRVMVWIGWSEQSIVITLRLINVAFVVASLFVYRMVLHSLGFSRIVNHGVLAFFIMIPIMPLMAGQINYDNPLLLLSALAILLTIRITTHLWDKKLPVAMVLGLGVTLLFGAVTKYGFVPIALGVVLWLVAALGMVIKKHHSLTFVWPKKSIMIILSIAIIFSSFFAARYVMNVVQYHELIPSCNMVFDKNACKEYGPWARNMRMANELPSTFEPLPFAGYIAKYWIPDMVQRLYFTLAGPTNGFQTKLPLFVPVTLSVVVASIGLSGLLLGGRRLFRRKPMLLLPVLLGLIYMGLLASKLYTDYKLTGNPVAINGRYLLLLIPLFGGLLAAGWTQLKFISLGLRKIFVVLCLIVIFLQGGGLSTYLINGESNWFWPGFGQTTQQAAKQVLDPVTLDSYR